MRSPRPDKASDDETGGLWIPLFPTCVEYSGKHLYTQSPPVGHRDSLAECSVPLYDPPKRSYLDPGLPA